VASQARGYVAGLASPHDPAPSPPDCQSAFQRIAKNCVHLIQRNRRSAIAADPEAIHAMRIELTRLRAAVLFFSPMVKNAAWLSIRKELSWLNSALGKARDHDVDANYTRRKRYRSWARSRRRALVRVQNKSHRSLAKRLDSARYNRLMMDLKHWITSGSWLLNGQSVRSERVDVYSQAQLREWRSEIWREGQHLRALRRKQLHRLRIECKRYRYIVTALQALSVTLGRQDVAFCETVRQVHRALGDHRDLKRLRKAVHGGRPPGYRKSKQKLLRQAEKPFRRMPRARPPAQI
jgi:CHAD domain-containing protein